uniref:Uncharacterized protein n=1 Tax=Physcomitrium patens TaxID=3218 RepID=A0A2K1KLG0_PHYPA|nr:hypothetical protein PHYPA_008291 [Physcomitrium patens]
MHEAHREKRPFEEVDRHNKVIICNFEQTVHQCKPGESPLTIGCTEVDLKDKWRNLEKYNRV